MHTVLSCMTVCITFNVPLCTDTSPVGDSTSTTLREGMGMAWVAGTTIGSLNTPARSLLYGNTLIVSSE